MLLPGRVCVQCVCKSGFATKYISVRNVITDLRNIDLLEIHKFETSKTL